MVHAGKQDFLLPHRWRQLTMPLNPVKPCLHPTEYVLKALMSRCMIHVKLFSEGDNAYFYSPFLCENLLPPTEKVSGE